MAKKNFLGCCLIFVITLHTFPQDIDDLFAVPDETIEEQSAEARNSNEIDDLFAVPDETIEESQAEEEQAESESSASPVEETIDIATLLQATGPEVRGSISLNGGFIVGFKNWNFTTEERQSEHVSAYYNLGLGVNLNVRISPELRAFASFRVGVSDDDLNISDSILDIFNAPSNNQSVDLLRLEVDELFIDYTLLNTLFFRIGIQSIQWGQGQLSDAGIVNPGRNPSFKLFIPLGNNGLTFFAYPSLPSNLTVDALGSINPLDFAYAGLFEFILGPFSFGISLRFHRILPHALASDIYIKTAFLGIDFTIETRLDFDTDPNTINGRDPTPAGMIGNFPPQFYLVTNLFWENSEIGLQIYGEYQFSYGPLVTVVTANGTPPVWAEHGVHIIGLGFTLTKLFPDGWNPSINWVHHIIEESGIVTIGIGGPIAPHLGLSFAIPMIYGPEYGLFRRNNPDPNNRVVGLRVELSITGGF